MPLSSSQPTDTSTPSSEDDASATTSSSTSTTPASFATLPSELRIQIIELACQLSHSSQGLSSATNLSPSQSKDDPILDLATTLDLLLVSTHFYRLAAPSLYRNVTLHRPSVLDAFLQLLIKRPQLGELVKSLHIGDVDQLPKCWHPLIKRSIHLNAEGQPVPPAHSFAQLGVTYVVSSLRTEDGPPSWSPPGTEWPSSLYRETERRSVAIAGALTIAQCCIGVELRIANWGYRGRRSMSDAAYLVAIMEVQAVLDLYILELHRLEQAGWTAFPGLKLSGYLFDSRYLPHTETTEGTYVISRNDVLRHLARPRCATDRFDHPLHPARLGIHLKPDGTTSFVPPIPTQSCAADDKSFLPSTATIPLMLDLLRSLLKHTTQLKALNVPSFLEGAICRRQATPLPLLRSLSIGPLPYGFPPQLFFGAFASLEVLHIRNVLLDERWVRLILRSLPALKTLTLDWRRYTRFGTEEDAPT